MSVGMPVRRRGPLAAMRGCLTPTVTMTAMALLLLLSSSWAILSGGWVPKAPAVPLAATVAVLEGALLARARVRRLWVVLLTPVMLAMAVVPFTLITMPEDPGASLGQVVDRYVADMLGGLLASTDWPFIVGLCTILWFCGYCAGWFAVGRRNGVAAILPVVVVLAINDINAPSHSHLPLPQAVTMLAAVLLVGACGYGSARRQWRFRGLPQPPRAAVRALCCAVPLALVAVALGRAVPPVSNHALTSFFQTFGENGNGSGNGTGSGGGAPGDEGPVTVGFSAVTEPGGSLTTQATPVLEYTTTNPSGVYLEGAVDSVDVDGNWSPLPHDYENTDLAWHSRLLGQGDAVPQDGRGPDGGIPADTVTSAVNLRYAGNVPVGTTLFSPGQPVSSSIATTVTGEATADGGYAQIDEMAAATDDPPGTVTVTGMSSVATASELEASAAYPVSPTDDPYPLWVSLTDQSIQDPEGISDVNQIAAQWTDGATTVYQAATDIESHLRNTSNFHYTLTPPAPPRNVEPLVYFLETSHQGYCQYFASAMGEMLRSLGIPTRLVTGYGPGTALVLGATTVHNVSTADAHVWVEVYFPGYGWVPFEPTPSSAQGGDYQTFPRGASKLPTGVTPAPVPTPVPTALPSPTATSTPHSSAGSTSATFLTSPWTPAVLLAVLLLLAVLMAYRWLRYPHGAAAAWRRMLLLGRLLGVARLPSETIEEVGRRWLALMPAAPRSAPAGTSAALALQELTALCGREVFAPAPLEAAELLRARECWHRVLSVLPGIVGATLWGVLSPHLPRHRH